jgi:hypothetical protein
MMVRLLTQVMQTVALEQVRHKEGQAVQVGVGVAIGQKAELQERQLVAVGMTFVWQELHPGMTVEQARQVF